MDDVLRMFERKPETKKEDVQMSPWEMVEEQEELRKKEAEERKRESEQLQKEIKELLEKLESLIAETDPKDGSYEWVRSYLRKIKENPESLYKETVALEKTINIIKLKYK